MKSHISASKQYYQNLRPYLIAMYTKYAKKIQLNIDNLHPEINIKYSG